MRPPPARSPRVEARLARARAPATEPAPFPDEDGLGRAPGWTLLVRHPTAWKTAVRRTLRGTAILPEVDPEPPGPTPSLRLKGDPAALRAWVKVLQKGPDPLPALGQEVDRALRGFFRRGPLTVRLGNGRKLRVGDRPLLMGVLNVTPDSFYDGGRYASVGSAVEHGLALASEGATLLDVGGESTRPGAAPVTVATELRRVLPVVERLVRDCPVALSVDTRRPEVARAVLRAGAHLINDVGGLRLPAMRRLLAREEAGVVVMHMRGTPRTMQSDLRYRDLRAELFSYLHDRLQRAEEEGLAPESMIVDPGIGFGKSYPANWEILAHLRELRALGRPVLVGVSRKGFLGEALGGAGPEDRLEASLAAALLAAERGADLLRVHDVAPTRRALAVLAPLERAGRSGGSREGH